MAEWLGTRLQSEFTPVQFRLGLRREVGILWLNEREERRGNGNSGYGASNGYTVTGADKVTHSSPAVTLAKPVIAWRPAPAK